MDAAELKTRADHLLDAQWVPGIQQQEIRASIQQLDTLLAQLTQQDPAAARTVLMRTQHLYERAERQYFSNLEPILKHGLEDLLDRLEPVLQSHNGHTPRHEHTRYLLENSGLEAQAGLAALHAPIKHFKHIPYSYLEAHRSESQDVIQALQAHNLPVMPEKHYHVKPLRSTETQPNLDLINAPEAWEYSSGEGVHVGIIDTGCDYTHQEIKQRFGETKGYNFITNTNDPYDDNGHGTHVAGTVAGKNTGVAPKTTLYALKFLDKHGVGSQTDFIRAAEWAIDEQLDVLNGSFGSNHPNPPEQAICDKLQEQGIAFIAAAGNNGDHSHSYPASYQSVLSVAAVDYDKTRAPFSQVNDQVGISAPGVGVRSCVPGGYDHYDGTSMATPHVSGSVALLSELYDTPAHAQELIITSAQELGPKEEYGVGLVRPDKAATLTHMARQ